MDDLTYQQKYYRANREKRKRRAREYNEGMRMAVLDILGRECECCGFDDVRALQVDHVNGGGVKEMKNNHGKMNYNKFILGKLLEGSEDYQVLCANCNWIKRAVRKEVRK